MTTPVYVRVPCKDALPAGRTVSLSATGVTDTVSVAGGLAISGLFGDSTPLAAEGLTSAGRVAVRLAVAVVARVVARLASVGRVAIRLAGVVLVAAGLVVRVLAVVVRFLTVDGFTVDEIFVIGSAVRDAKVASICLFGSSS